MTKMNKVIRGLKRLTLPSVYVILSLTLFGIGIEERILWLYLFGLVNTIVAMILLQNVIHTSNSTNQNHTDNLTENSGLLSYSSTDENDIEHNVIEESERPRITRITLDDK